MLHASRFKATEGQLSTIVGGAGGKRVKCSSQALPVYNDLVGLANGGNYWAGLVVKGIKALTSGRMSMNNVYVQKETQLAYGRGIFYLVLPGVRATLEDCADGTYELRGLKADENYMRMQKDKQKPGLWRVSKELQIDPVFQSNGEIQRENFRPVVVSDRATDDPRDIAKAARNDLVKVDATIERMVSGSGFDLHHTPGNEGGIVGLKAAHKAIATAPAKAITESATLLANTMYRARNIEGVLWFSDWGGSAVLTRAMQILAREKNAGFKNHAIFLNRPTSNASEALALAEKLEFKLGGKGGKSTGLRLNEVKGNHLRAEISIKGAIQTTSFGVSAAGASYGLAGIAPTVGGIVGLVGALAFVTSTVRVGMPKLSGKKYK